MAGELDKRTLEKTLASTVTRTLTTNLRASVRSTTDSQTGTAERTTGSQAKFKNGWLQRIAIKAPHYIFKQNYGFEGVKSNSVNMRLKQTSSIEKALEESNVLDILADGISEIRLDRVAALIQFSKNGK